MNIINRLIIFLIRLNWLLNKDCKLRPPFKFLDIHAGGRQ